MPDLILGSNVRIFTIENGAGPANAPAYQQYGRAGAGSWGQGSSTPLRIASDSQYGKFDTVKVQRGAADLPSLTVEARMQEAASTWLELTRRGCAFDVHLNIGSCQDPRDYDGGWSVKRILEGAQVESYDFTDMGAFDADDDQPVTESLPLSGLEMYDVSQIRGTEQAAAEATDEVIGVVVADRIACGTCGAPSDGCSTVLAVTVGTTGSPGLPVEVLFTIDGGVSWSETNVNSMGLADTADDIASMGDYILVTTRDGAAVHYALLADILDGTDVWTSVTTGLDASGDPNKITVVSANHAWVSGDGGRIYFTSDPTALFTEQADGSLTSENLNGIHALDQDNVVAVGANNAVLVTANGGTTWTLVVGPAVGVVLNAVWMRTELEWLVGDAAGNLWYTQNAGSTWTARAFTGSGGGQIRDIVFATKSVGYMAHDTALAVGRILRTTNGGQSWYLLPEEAGVTMPASDRVNSLAACGYDDVNVVYGGGLGDDATDGIMLKVA